MGIASGRGFFRAFFYFSIEKKNRGALDRCILAAATGDGLQQQTRIQTNEEERLENAVGVNKRTRVENERTKKEKSALHACDAKAEPGTMSVRVNRCSSQQCQGAVWKRAWAGRSFV
jgi:hypothetical protein